MEGVDFDMQRASKTRGRSPLHRESDLRYMVYASSELSTRILTQRPRNIDVNVRKGRWFFGGRGFNIGQWTGCFRPNEGVPVFVFDCTRSKDLESIVKAQQLAEKKFSEVLV